MLLSKYGAKKIPGLCPELLSVIKKRYLVIPRVFINPNFMAISVGIASL